ncbi:hypothetical protein lbkm_4058 [Lachnospiraceae bacterium KM106-2]|nr:hypothetical protein lbkm_4058 [Lachnospiraceae bacterium KM106-2]
MRCPYCNDPNCVILQETESTQKGFGVCKSICGYIILGPIGLLCGLCGMGEGTKKTKHYWVCQRCGRKFRV